MMSQLIFIGGSTSDFSLTKFVNKGCPLSPLLFAIVIYPLLVILSRLATNGDIVGPHPLFRGPVAQALTNYSSMFLSIMRQN